jgi:hypothetical protein
MCKVNIAAYDRRILPHWQRIGARGYLVWLGVFRNNAYVLKEKDSIRGNGLQFVLDLIGRMRHNNTYTICTQLSDGKAEKARPQNTGAQTHRYPELAPRIDFRRLVQREPILRPQGSSPGALRNAAPARRGRKLDRRCGYQLRCFAPHLLSVAGGIPTSGPKRTASQAPWAKGRTQALHQRHRICAELAGHRAGPDDRRLYQSGSGKVWNLSSPPQSGTGVGEQKKTAQASVSPPISEGAVSAYEGLRRQAVQPDRRIRQSEGFSVLMRCGLAAWAQLGPSIASTHLPEPLCELPVLASPGAELIRLLASLILSTRQEKVLHA